MTEEQQKAKPISIKEFRMWLEGVEEMQAEGWAPDARQWKRIREKLNEIEEVANQPVSYYPPNARGPAYDETRLPPGTNLVFPPMDGTPPSSAAGGTHVPMPSSLNTQPTAPTVRRAAATASGLPVTLSGGSPTQPVKTPDIDTGHGKTYNSQFA